MKSDTYAIEELEQYINERQMGQMGGENAIVDDLFALAHTTHAGSGVRQKVEQGIAQRRYHIYQAPSQVFIRLASIAAALAIAFAIIVAVPALRVQAQALWDLFTVGETDQNPGLQPTVEPPTVAPDATGDEFHEFAGPKATWGLSVEEITSSDEIPFEVRIPTYLPAGFSYDDGAIDHSVPGVQLVYVCSDRLAVLFLDMYSLGKFEVANLAQPVGASAQVEAIQVGDVTGEYVAGNFGLDGTWDSSLPVQTLSWIEGEVFYRLNSYDQDSECPVSQQDMIKIAESLQ